MQVTALEAEAGLMQTDLQAVQAQAAVMGLLLQSAQSRCKDLIVVSFLLALLPACTAALVFSEQVLLTVQSRVYNHNARKSAW